MSTVAPSDQRPSTEEQPDSHGAADTVGEVVRQVKPQLRGWLHAGMAPLAAAAGIVLVCLAPDRSRRIAAAIFLAASLLLFGTSAIYHRGSTGAPAATRSCAGWTTRTSTCSSPRPTPRWRC